MPSPQARWADLRFFFGRVAGLAQRTAASLRARGWRATVERIASHLRPAPRHVRDGVYAPAAAPFMPFAVATSEMPVASIVIPVYGEFTHTLACLRALAAHPPAAPFEVIVVDDGSPDETPHHLPEIAGVRYHPRSENGGFIAACNDGAALARGEYLIFLNNDTVPQPGWLDALLDTFRTHPDTGLAGSQLLYPDGRLQESGGLVFSDGSGWNHGRFGDPDDPRHAFVREADYCSGAAIAIPTMLFMRIGGFDTRYAPAYYEDTDLAFAVRAQGLQVRVQPFSRVVHHEGATSGTDVTQGAKAYQVRNREVFARKWATELAAHAPPGTPADEAVRAKKPSVLVVDARTPDPTRDSGSLRLCNVMELLRAEGAHVAFVPVEERGGGDATRRLQRAGIEAWHAPHAERIPAWLRVHAARFDTVLLCRHYIAGEIVPLLRRHAPRARIVFDTVDLHFLRERRNAEVLRDRAMAAAAEATRRRELAVVAACEATLVVSPVERELLARECPGARVEVLSNVHVVVGPGKPCALRKGLVFVGGFRHPPNVDAVLWFTREVFPLVHAAHPDIAFHCIGGDPPARILELAGLPGVHVHGHVPDITPYMDGARVALAPLRFGAGVKGKVNLSMAHGQPVVATSCAVEGMHLQDGVDVLVADEPRAFADAVLRLYTDEGLWNRLAANGLENVARHFSMDAARGVVRRVVLGLPDDGAAPTVA